MILPHFDSFIFYKITSPKLSFMFASDCANECTPFFNCEINLSSTNTIYNSASLNNRKSYQPVMVFGYVVLTNILIHNFIFQLSPLLFMITINGKRQQVNDRYFGHYHGIFTIHLITTEVRSKHRLLPLISSLKF